MAINGSGSRNGSGSVEKCHALRYEKKTYHNSTHTGTLDRTSVTEKYNEG